MSLLHEIALEKTPTLTHEQEEGVASFLSYYRSDPSLAITLHFAGSELTRMRYRIAGGYDRYLPLDVLTLWAQDRRTMNACKGVDFSWDKVTVVYED